MYDEAPKHGSTDDHPLAPATPSGRAEAMRAILRGKEGRGVWDRRYLGLAFALLSVVILASQAPVLLEAFGRPNVNGYAGVDYRLYMEASHRWLAGGPFYEQYQLVGPYPITPGDILYPPVALWLFAPFTFLPAILWWVVPLGLTAIVVWRLRPGPISWPIMALCLAWPPTQVKIITGNPVIWSLAAVALGCLYRWPSVLVLLKPSLFPFALFGVRDRSWWTALGGLALISVPFGTMWVDWLRTVVDARGGGIAYSIQEVPILLLPLVAWACRRKHPGCFRRHSPFSP